MKSKVFVLVPYAVPPDQIGSYVDQQLVQHRFDENGPRGGRRFDYLAGPLETCFNDKVAEGRVPPKIRRSFQGNICEMNRLPPKVNSGAVVTPDRVWHDLSDFGWKMTEKPTQANQEAAKRWEVRVRELLSSHPDCWVVTIWAHS
jgi:hypothetical protein